MFFCVHSSLCIFEVYIFSESLKNSMYPQFPVQDKRKVMKKIQKKLSHVSEGNSLAYRETHGHFDMDG